MKSLTLRYLAFTLCSAVLLSATVCAAGPGIDDPAKNDPTLIPSVSSTQSTFNPAPVQQSQIPISGSQIPTIYSNPSLPKFQKIEQQKTTVIEKTETAPGLSPLETVLVNEPQSPLEKMITADESLESARIAGDATAKSLTQFGYGFFRNIQFSPQTDVPVSADYLIGPGDTLVVNVWGSIEGIYEQTVSRTGEIVLPKIGPVKVAGIPFGKLTDVLRVKLAKVFRDFDLAVNMGKLRTIKVYVVGEVVKPGDYSVSSLSTVMNVLGLAGGPTKNGTLRQIKIARAGGGEEVVDLYDFFTRGDKSRDVRLMSGDTIFVPVIGRIAGISGNVKRPGIYELKHETTLKELLDLAEGVTATGYLQRVQISRVEANRNKSVLEVNLVSEDTGKSVSELAASTPIRDLDIVRVFPINSLLREHFKVEGHVERPGFYSLKPGLRVSDLLSPATLLPEYAPSVFEITRLYPPDLHPKKLLLKLDLAMSKDPANNIELKEFDSIRVFSRWEMEEMPKVKISGEVQKPGAYRLLQEMRLRDLVIAAGSFKQTAYLKNIEINRLQRSGEAVKAISLNVNAEEAFKGNPEQNILLEPFDEITVRRLPNWADAAERYVELKGEVVFPGTYPVYKGERLSSLLERAGGFTDKAYLKGAKFTREVIRLQQQQRMDEVLVRTENDIISKQTELLSTAASKEELEATKAALAGLEKQIQLLKAKKAEGRLVIKLDAIARIKGTASDVELAGGDSLFVPTNLGSVSILGNVYNPTTLLVESDRSLEYYLDKTGGATNDADESSMYLIKADGSVISTKQMGSLFFNPFLSQKLDSGDTIVVPQKIEKTAWLRDIKDITTILSQLAITAGTVILGLR